MHSGRTAVNRLAALTFGVSLTGCFSLPGTPSLPPQQRRLPMAAPPSDLRIAAGAAPEIPLVPLPVPPVDSKQSAPVSRPAPNNPTAPAPAAPVVAKTADVQPGAPGATPLGNPLRRLQQEAAARYATMDSYIVRLTRRETVRGKDKPQEVMLFKFRKEPWSLHFRWLDGEGQGREVIYVKDRYENKLHTLLAAGDMPLAPAGKRLALPVDSMLVRSNSRHAITEAGIGASIGRLGMLLDAVERGDRRWGTLNDLGAQARPEFPMPARAIEHVIPPGAEQDLPGGGRRTYWFDPETKLPLLVTARDDRGKEVEYYFYSHLLYPVRLDDNDFNPDKLWPAPGPGGPGRTGRP
jgi:hypothetical protein